MDSWTGPVLVRMRWLCVDTTHASEVGEFFSYFRKLTSRVLVVFHYSVYYSCESKT